MAPPSLPQSLGRLPRGSQPQRSQAFDLPAVTAAVGLARRNVRRLLDRWGIGEEAVDNAVLVTSELVTNAVMHTVSDRVVCRVSADGRRLRIEVQDENLGGTLPARRRPAPDDQSGRGLVLVDVLCSDWGVRDAPQGAGRVVWAELSPEPAEAELSPQPDETAATGPPAAPATTPHLRPAPQPAEGPPPHGPNARH
ncbi:ATP-binding protein [Streptomyces sp. SID2888]|nr:ATP-binding protein [Streptomyces sp. SID2888]